MVPNFSLVVPDFPLVVPDFSLVVLDFKFFPGVQDFSRAIQVSSLVQEQDFFLVPELTYSSCVDETLQRLSERYALASY